MLIEEIRILAIRLARIEEALKEDDELESDNEMIRKKSLLKGKGKLTKRGVTLDMLQKKIDIFKEAAEP